MENIVKTFEEQGGLFISPPSFITEKLSSIKAFIFDWDGVFNDSFKRDNSGSPFSEADSMGLNMLRFSYYLKQDYIPKLFIITGENNQPAVQLSKREAFAGVYLKVKHKTEALNHICQEHGIKPEEVAFSFDDILDLGLAKEAGLRFMVRRDASPLLTDLAKSNSLVDYYTGNDGGHFAVREISELIIGLNQNYETTIFERSKFSERYQSFLKSRNNIIPRFYSGKTGNIETQDL